ncbi:MULTISPECIES: glycoside hydrolase family 15 protein [Kocuria]|uniref:Glycoside hydrolase family 15 protein n=1 Tax=Kocuria subflava TaxID=1736139 RepID=A0A846TN65_9MICC|nr:MULTISPECIES: glycoside hydrolase family 15 protein [Kocuria]NKE09883.1 glycoside hydrolase family 15 protein [Kocuria subflava]
MASLIEDYALLSDMQTGPLVSRRGSVDWLCVPRFDSPAVFGALLGTAKDGRWLLAPAATVEHDGTELPEQSWQENCRVGERFYAENTFVLQTVWITDAGSVRVTDFMPLTEDLSLVRRVEGLTGEVEMFQEVRMRFDYGQLMPWVSQFESAEDPVTENPGATEVIALAGPDAMVLRGEPIPAFIRDQEGPRHAGRFTVAAGQTRDFVLTYFPSHRTPPAPMDVGEQLRETKQLWRDWDQQWSVENPRELDHHVRRSLLVIRSLMHQQTGGLAGSASAALPEKIGGDRNWDARFTWVRDATFALEVMLNHGHDREALQLRNWLLRCLAGDPEALQSVYGLAGERATSEHSLDLPGYERSRPVRVGNGASRAHQSDTVGHVLVAFEKLRRRGLEEDRLSWPLQKALLGHVLKHYEDADQSLWEMRGDPQFYTHSRVMMWAALQSGVDAVKIHGLDGDLQLWETHRDQLALEIWTSGYDPAQGSFVQHYGSTHVDASLLLLPTVGFVAWDDPRMVRTAARIAQELSDDDGLLRRYRNVHLPPDSPPEDFESQVGQDGFAGEDAGHLSVTLWLVVNLAHSGEVERAREVLEAVLKRGNDLGLLAAAYDGDPDSGGRMLGNLPQVLPHLSLIQAIDAIHHVTAGSAHTGLLDDPDNDPRPDQPDQTHESGAVALPAMQEALRQAGNAALRESDGVALRESDGAALRESEGDTAYGR